MDKQKDKESKEEKKLREKDIKGKLYFKAEWKGNGPKMPPSSAENLFTKEKSNKNRFHYNED